MEWFIENKSMDKHSVAATKTYGTSRMDAYSIFEDTLNLKTVTVRDRIDDGDGRYHYEVNKNETMLAREKQNMIKEKFKEWLFAEPERRQKYVEYYNETRQSPGYARQCGMDHAHGKYHFFIDADTMYPSCYVDQMMKKLIKDDVSCVGTLWSFYPDKQHSQAELFFFEFVRDTFLWMQHFKRPELCVRGMTMAFNMDYAKHLSVRTDIRRGEDGSLALELKSYGKIDFLYCRKARPITGYGTLGNRSMFDIFVERVRIQSKRLLGIFHKQDHYEDTDSNLIK